MKDIGKRQEKISAPVFFLSNITSTANQMEVIRAVIKKAVSLALLRNFRATLGAIFDSFETDMPQKYHWKKYYLLICVAKRLVYAPSGRKLHFCVMIWTE